MQDQAKNIYNKSLVYTLINHWHSILSIKTHLANISLW